jgi:4'-phosphopantetheinyl transferase
MLFDNELHVWRARLDLSPVTRERLQNTLSSDEKERAERFLIPEAREHFVAARGILRELLGGYLEVQAERVVLTFGPEGKPSLSPKHKSRIRFNVAHSHGMGLFVFAHNHEIGVDIEYVQNDFRGMEIASHFFSQREVAALSKLPPSAIDQAFFDCWTRKEAYVKAHGQGLSIPLGSFAVDFNDSTQVLQDETGARWSCYALEAAPGFAGAVVAEGENWRVKCLDWAGEPKNAASSPLVERT